MIKLVGVDVDGTLLNRNLEIPPRTQAAIATARARGVRFAIVTGRMFKSAVPLARTLGLDGPLVAYNGAMVAEHPSGRILFQRGVDPAAGRMLAAFCEQKGYHVQAYVGDQLYVGQMNRHVEAYTANAGVEAREVGPLSRWLSEASTKMLIIDDPDRIPQIQKEVRAVVGDAVDTFTSMPDYLEVLSPGVSKGEGLERVAAELAIAREDVMAIGDGMNDVPMFQWAGMSAAVVHAPEPLKRVAGFVTESGPGDAVAEALERMGLA